jgi:pimeloyl-ACP methyl ester carboxylesterase
VYGPARVNRDSATIDLTGRWPAPTMKVLEQRSSATMATRYPHTGSPRSIYSALEIRAFAELATLPWALPFLAAAPHGDGHPVLLIPGFLSGEWPLYVLKAFLANRGYDVQTWGFGRNVGFRPKHVAALHQKIRYLHHKTGRKVSLVGWSLGGSFAAHAAYHLPDCVRAVVTLGSPVSVDQQGSASTRAAKVLYRLVAHPMGPAAHTVHTSAKGLRRPPPVPMTCIYTLSDGVVPPQEATIAGNPALHENIEVPGSHTGLGFNPLVLWIVADRLAQPEAGWQPFAPSGPAGFFYRYATRFALPA